uniref:Uncharacterized protein n=1 Tax=Physcomitrium patens TaxID=3218 RepID=A0A7I4EUA9_PHYPA
MTLTLSSVCCDFAAVPANLKPSARISELCANYTCTHSLCLARSVAKTLCLDSVLSLLLLL